MLKNRIISIICVMLCIILSFSFVCSANGSLNDTLYTVTASKDEKYCVYGSTNVEEFTSSQAANNGIPSGYSGNVFSVKGSGSKGALIDFSSSKIPTSVISSMTFRIYVGDDARPNDSYPEVRISWPNNVGNWVMRYSVSSKTDRWVDITLDANGQNFYGNVGFNNISKDGYLDKFELCIRTHASNDYPFYIDDISVKYKENDNTAPVINYTGESEIRVPEDADIPISATAYDDFEKRNVEVFWVWPVETQMTDKNTPVAGTYNAKLCAKDFFGNTAEHSVTVVVVEKDVTAPTIDLRTDKIYAVVGTIPRLSVKVSDNNELKSTEYVWSKNAFDRRGRLVEGTHTWTIVAEDLSENRTTKTLTVYVTKDEKQNSNVIDEEVLSQSEHKLTHFEKVDATKDSNGNIEYYYCKTCDKYFKDAQGKHEISKADTVIEKLKEENIKDIISDILSPNTGEVLTGAVIIAVFCIVASWFIFLVCVKSKKKL